MICFNDTKFDCLNILNCGWCETINSCMNICNKTNNCTDTLITNHKIICTDDDSAFLIITSIIDVVWLLFLSILMIIIFKETSLNKIIKIVSPLSTLVVVITLQILFPRYIILIDIALTVILGLTCALLLKYKYQRKYMEEHMHMDL